MVKSNLAIMMAKHGVRTIAELSAETGISRSTLTTLYYANGKGVQFETLDRLCAYLNCNVGDILVHKERESA